MLRKLTLILLGLLLCAGAAAQFRTIPDNAKRGSMTHVRENLVTLDGRQVLLAAGAQIRSHNNLLIVPSQLPPQSLVKYQLDRDGLVNRAWVLSAEEAARPDRPASQQ